MSLEHVSILTPVKYLEIGGHVEGGVQDIPYHCILTLARQEHFLL